MLHVSIVNRAERTPGVARNACQVHLTNELRAGD